MKLFLLGILAIAFNVNAKDVELNGKYVHLGNLGDVRSITEVATNGDINLIRTSKTPEKVQVIVSAKYPEMVCARTSVHYYPCGTYYPPRPRPGYPYPAPYPYPGSYRPGLCSTTVCVEYRTVLVERTNSLRLNFKKSVVMDSNDQEIFNVRITSNGYSLDHDMIAPNYYDVRRFLNRYKFKKQ